MRSRCLDDGIPAVREHATVAHPSLTRREPHPHSADGQLRETRLQPAGSLEKKRVRGALGRERHGARIEALASQRTPMLNQEIHTEAIVLVVDDNQENRATYAEYLRCVGFRVLEAEDGRAAVATALAKSPAVIVLDLEMPVMNGWDAIRELRADARTRGIPLVVLSGYTAPWPPSSAMGACDAILRKPCVPEDLSGVVEALASVSKTASPRQLRDRRPPLA